MQHTQNPRRSPAPSLELTTDQVNRIRQFKKGSAADKTALQELSGPQMNALLYGLWHGGDALSRRFRKKWLCRVILVFACLILGSAAVFLLLRIDTAATPTLLPVKAGGIIAGFCVLFLGLRFALASTRVFSAYLIARAENGG